MNEISFPNLGLKFNIDPIAFKIGFIQIHWYALIIVFGILLGFLYAVSFCKKDKADTEVLYDILLYGLPSSIICARAYYVIFNYDVYRGHFADIFKIYEGGIAIYGAVIGGVISTLIYCRKKKKNVWQYFDYSAAGLLVGQCIGRWGNFVNQEAFGGNFTGLLSMKGNIIEETLESLKESGVAINPALGVHPTFLYESLWNFLGLIIIYFVFKKRKNYGEPFAFYLIWYGIGRFFIEGMRTDSLMLTSNIRISQVVAIACIIFGLTVFIKKKKKIVIEAE